MNSRVIEIPTEKVDQLIEDLRTTSDGIDSGTSRSGLLEKLKKQHDDKLSAKQQFAEFLAVAREKWQAFVRPQQLGIAASTSKPIETIWEHGREDSPFRIVVTKMPNGNLELLFSSKKLELNGVRIYSPYLQRHFCLFRQSKTEVRAKIPLSRFQRDYERLFDFELPD